MHGVAWSAGVILISSRNARMQPHLIAASAAEAATRSNGSMSAQVKQHSCSAQGLVIGCVQRHHATQQLAKSGTSLRVSGATPNNGTFCCGRATPVLQVGSVFEYLDKNALFGVVQPDSPLWAPILGLFAITGLPTAGANNISSPLVDTDAVRMRIAGAMC
eukprot:GHRQ01013818.1.p2 GENE.GHRQ01013818.1~~GHRQ01013818.1.p2  ORF type:complete len:161 (-),score=22.91 GHRQ01013818.1:901-1383(-)